MSSHSEDIKEYNEMQAGFYRPSQPMHETIENNNNGESVTESSKEIEVLIGVQSLKNESGTQNMTDIMTPQTDLEHTNSMDDSRNKSNVNSQIIRNLIQHENRNQQCLKDLETRIKLLEQTNEEVRRSNEG